MVVLSLDAPPKITAQTRRRKIPVTVSHAPGQAEELREGMAFEKKQERLGEILEIAEEPVRRELAGIGYLTEYYRDVRLEKWNVEVVISNDQGFAEGEEIEGSVVTKESKVLDFDLIREVRRRIEN